MNIKCIYKLWLLTKKINIKIKTTEKIDKAFIIEINIIKNYIENLKNTDLYNWYNSSTIEDQAKYLTSYIQKNTKRI